MSRKVYSLYHLCPENNIFRSDEYKIEISCKVAFANNAKKLEESGEEVMYHNSNYFLSFSRAALVRKAKEIRQGWIEKEQEKIKEIEGIIIK